VREQRPTEEAPVEEARLVPGQTRNHVAVLVPLTGLNAGVGTSIANAANLALLDSKETGIKLTVYDTGSSAAAAANAALADGNRLFLGPLLAEDVTAVAPIARAQGVPVIAFSNDVGVAGEGTYIMGFTPDQSIGQAVAYARGKGAARFAGLMPTNPYGERAALALRRAVAVAGGRLVAVQTYARGTASLTAAVRGLAAKGQYDALVIGDSPSVAAGGGVDRAWRAGARRAGDRDGALERRPGDRRQGGAARSAVRGSAGHAVRPARDTVPRAVRADALPAGEPGL
jgi:outer membrane PBP1 activator LpoA protein